MFNKLKRIFKIIDCFFEKYLIYFVLLFFLVAFLAKSLLLHFSFNSHSWDLGIYSQQTWTYSHFSGFYNTVRGTNLLSDHFGLILYLFAPFYRAYPHAETILVIQAVLVVLSAYPIYLLSKKFLKSGLAGSALVFAFLSSSGIRQGIDFDFHLATVAVFFYSFFLYFWISKKNGWAVIFAILAMLCKEDVPLYIAFTALGLIILNIKDKKEIKKAVLLFVGAAASFLLIMAGMSRIPSTGANFNYFTFNYLGHNYSELIKNVIAHPVLSGKLIWTNFINNPIKINTFTTYFGGFWYLPFLAPDVLVFSIPFLLTKFVSDRETQWGLNGQYSVTGMFMLTIATLYAIYRLSRLINEKWRKPVIVLWTIVFLLFTFNYNFLKIRGAFWNMFEKKQWGVVDEYLPLNKLIKEIPPGSSVATQDKILPHLTDRKEIYLFRCQYCQIGENKTFDYLLFSDMYNFEFALPGTSDSVPVINELLAKGMINGQGSYVLVDKTENDLFSAYLLKRSTK